MAEEDSKSREQLRKNDDNISDEKSSSESPPSKIARISPEESSGTVTTAVVPQPLNLGLNLTLATESSSAATESSKTGFTFMQLQEYYHQELIFKHILAGMPVPIHLVLPIWKSVAASYGPHHYPSFAGLGHLCHDFRNSMEPEPGRCRRTDGKKWRCSRDVVPEQKYCERHMHRGRNRSRKTVELTVSDSTPSATITIDEDSNDGTGSNDVTIARIGVSPISVLSNGSTTTCKTSVV